jgi:hypothetical protein
MTAIAQDPSLRCHRLHGHAAPVRPDNALTAIFDPNGAGRDITVAPAQMQLAVLIRRRG